MGCGDTGAAARGTTTLSVRIDSDTKSRLEALAQRARRSKSFLAAEAIAASPTIRGTDLGRSRWTCRGIIVIPLSENCCNGKCPGPKPR
ncbi:MAG: ribbon-helix-helix protein, CopG family [Acidobacteria bacterium]|nr:ribbon-helix-helix protein, CopG family [Acidobacteriota bacterium]